MIVKRIQLALIHLAVAMTLVPINSTLNRVMIKEMAISATLVSILASLPYLFSPIQVLIGSYSDRHPWLGWRRTPYIALGLLLCAAGVALAPVTVFVMPVNYWGGLLLCLLSFGAWGMGYNVATVAYLSLASELSGEKGRGRTVALMWFVMIIGIIFTAAALSRLLENYSPQALERSFRIVAGVALAFGLLGLVRLEPHSQTPPAPAHRASWQELLRGILANTQARSFFVYLTVMLAAILGQDVLLEPYAGEAFGLPVRETTRITSIWGVCVLVTLLAAGYLERRTSKMLVARVGAAVAILGFLMVAGSGLVNMLSLFYGGVVVLGLGTGLATVSNLSLMLDMTTARVGLFMGAWGVSNALSRLLGTILSGAVRDVVSNLSGNLIGGYVTVFTIQAGLLLVSWVMLSRINVDLFRKQGQNLSVEERAALLEEGG